MASVTPTNPDTPEGPTVELSRTTQQSECDSCGPKPPRSVLLDVTMDKNWVTLCPECEGELLRKLLRNYLKRRSKGSKVGFTDDIPKEEEQEIPAWPQEILE